MKLSAQKNAAFTVVELLVVVTVGALFFGLVMVGYRNFLEKKIVSSAIRDIESSLRLIKTKAISGEKPTACSSNPLYGYQVDILDNGTVEWVAECDCGGDSCPTNTLALKSITWPRPDEEVRVTKESPSAWPISFKSLSGRMVNNLADDQAVVISVEYLTESQTLTVYPSGLIE